MRSIRVRMYRRNPAKSRKRKHTRWKKISAHKRRVNPFKKKRAVRRRATRRRNPALSLRSALNKNVLLRALGLGVGFIGGLQVVSLVKDGTAFGRQVFTPPAFLASVRPGLGLVPIIVGGVIAAKGKKAITKDIAYGIIAAGSVDVIRSVISVAAPSTAAAVGLYENVNLSTYAKPQSLGLYVNKRPASVGRIGPTYKIPATSELQLGGYNNSSFASVDSSFT